MAEQPDPAPAENDDPELPDLLADDRLTVAGLLFEVVGGVADAFDGQIAENGLATSEFEVLLRLARSPGRQLRMTDLARQVGLSSSGLTRLADRLEGRGLLERRACPTDGRGSNALVTAEGLALLTSVLPGHLALIERWLTGALDPDQLDGLTGALRAVRARVRPDAEAGAHSSPVDAPLG